MANLVSNRAFSQSSVTFKKACELASLPVTVRQASKWRMKKGTAYLCRNEGQEYEADELHKIITELVKGGQSGQESS